LPVDQAVVLQVVVQQAQEIHLQQVPFKDMQVVQVLDPQRDQAVEELVPWVQTHLILQAELAEQDQLHGQEIVR
jgi:hypothetical protein